MSDASGTPTPPAPPTAEPPPPADAPQRKFTLPTAFTGLVAVPFLTIVFVACCAFVGIPAAIR
jgi:hypothetical protein